MRSTHVALSADALLLEALRVRPCGGAVHSVFARALNLATTEHGLVTLVVPGVDDGPSTIVVDVEDFGACRQGDRASFTVDALVIAQRFQVSLQGVRLWHAALPAYPSCDAALRDNVAHLRRAAASALLEPHAAVLCQALRQGDADAACAAGRAMLGLGSGLTPSGDDFLVGVLAVLNLSRSPCAALRSLARPLLADIEQRTNAISIAALRAAAAGRVRASVQALLQALVEGGQREVIAALERVLAIGATSGRDIVAGVLCGFDACLRRPRR